MKRIFLPLFHLCVCLCLCSCYSTIVGQSFYYPPGFKPAEIPVGDGYGSVTFDDSGALFQVYIQATGALGKAYVDRSVKKPQVEFYRHGVAKGVFHYSFRAAALDYDVAWSGPGICTIHFYDLPDGVASSEKRAKKMRTEIGRKQYRYDEKADVFREIP
jgi:hypothetical protein